MMTVQQRLAVASDAAAVTALMRASILALFPHFYSAELLARGADHIAHEELRP